MGSLACQSAVPFAECLISREDTLPLSMKLCSSVMHGLEQGKGACRMSKSACVMRVRLSRVKKGGVCIYVCRVKVTVGKEA